MDHLTSFFPAGRDRGVTVAIEGFFAFAWFGWGQAAAPSWLVAPLAVGDGLAVLLAVAGVVMTIRSAGRLRVMADPAVRRRAIQVAPSLPGSIRWLTVASISTRGGVRVSELWRKSAVELAAMIRNHEVSSREVVQAHLDRIEAVNPHLNAIVRLLPDQALAAADGADRAVADGTRLGPLHGVPFTVKENIDLAGTPAAVVPAGMADGLPVGVQVMGGKYTELRCLAVAEAIEQRLGPLTPIDPVTG